MHIYTYVTLRFYSAIFVLGLYPSHDIINKERIFVVFVNLKKFCKISLTVTQIH